MLADPTCLKALEKVGLDKMAEELAQQCERLGGDSAETVLGFLQENEETDHQFIAKLAIKVERVP